MQYSHLITQPDGYQLFIIDHPEAIRAMRRKRILWDVTCWRFASGSKRIVQSACYEVEGIGSIHAPYSAVPIPPLASDVLICSQNCSGLFFLASAGCQHGLPDATSLAEHLTKLGLDNRPILLGGRILFPDVETLRLFATAVVRLTFIDRSVDVDAIHAKFGGLLCTYINTHPHQSGTPVRNLLFTDEIRGGLAASVAYPFHPKAKTVERGLLRISVARQRGRGCARPTR